MRRAHPVRSPAKVQKTDMAQIFHRSTNFISRFSVFSALFLIGFALLAVLGVARSPYLTRQNISREQPVQFSHKHHVADDGIDCRYCHTGVETSAVAGIPPTKTCMNCHSVLFNNVGYLEPVRESYRTDKSIQWVKVHRLADFVYFNHSIHVNKGVGCTTCHGQVDQMPLVFQANTLLMQWCLDCHRNPEPNLRPMGKVFAMDWKPGPDQEELGKKLAVERKIRTTAELTSCSTCHR
jgi:cytochrome c7-like protein